MRAYLTIWHYGQPHHLFPLNIYRCKYPGTSVGAHWQAALLSQVLPDLQEPGQYLDSLYLLVHRLADVVVFH